MKRKIRSTCPLNLAIEEIGDRWSLLIIRDLMGGKRYFREFLKSNEKIASNILSSRLQQLEELKIIKKEKDEHHKQKIKYSLTQKGIDLLPLIYHAMIWSAKYQKVSDNSQDKILKAGKELDKMEAILVAEHLK